MYGIFATGYLMNSKNNIFFKCDSLMSNNEQSEQDSAIYKRDGHSSLKKIQIYQNGILIMSQILVVCLQIVVH